MIMHTNIYKYFYLSLRICVCAYGHAYLSICKSPTIETALSLKLQRQGPDNTFMRLDTNVYYQTRKHKSPELVRWLNPEETHVPPRLEITVHTCNHRTITKPLGESDLFKCPWECPLGHGQFASCRYPLHVFSITNSGKPSYLYRSSVGTTTGTRKLFLSKPLSCTGLVLVLRPVQESCFYQNRSLVPV